MLVELASYSNTPMTFFLKMEWSRFVMMYAATRVARLMR